MLEKLGVKVVAASTDSVADTASLAEDQRLGYVTMLAELDGAAVAAATGAALQTGDRVFLHATGFILDSDGRIVNSVYSSGPIGRFSANDALRKIVFEQARAG